MDIEFHSLEHLQFNAYLAQIIMLHSDLPEKEVNVAAVLYRVQKMRLWGGRNTYII